jgi:hypothetical protein
VLIGASVVIRSATNCAACVANPAWDIEAVGGNVVAVGAHWVRAVAQVDGLVPVQGAQRGQRSAKEADGRVAEHGHRGDVVGDVGRHWLCEAKGRLVGHRDDVDDGRALRVPAENNLGVRAGGGHVLNEQTGVVGSVGRTQEVPRCGVVDGVDGDGLALDQGPQRVDERLTNPSDTVRLSGAACEHDLDCRTRIRLRRGDGRPSRRKNGGCDQGHTRNQHCRNADQQPTQRRNSS